MDVGKSLMSCSECKVVLCMMSAERLDRVIVFNRPCRSVTEGGAGRFRSFSAMHMTREERSLLHGNDERIRLEAVGKAVEFFMRIMKQL